MNKKLVVVAALIFGAAGLFLANTVKAQDATDNSVTNSDAGAAPVADNSAAPAAPAAQ